MNLTDTQILGWIGQYFWPFLRIGAALMSAPLFGSRALPARFRLIFALALTVAIAPTLAPQPPVTTLSAAGVLTVVQQLMVGLVMGFALQIIFEAVTLGGELISGSMGLSFAQMADPVRGVQTPVIGAFLNAFAALCFLSLGGHLMLIHWLHHSFAVLPVGAELLPLATIEGLLRAGGQIFAGALLVALPALATLLLVNLAFGVLSRSSPSLNVMGVGLPISLTAGLLMLAFSLPGIQSVFGRLLTETSARILQWFGG